MNPSSSLNVDGASADSKPAMAKGSEHGAAWTADAALQDVLLTSNTAETENSCVSDDAYIKAQEDPHADANDPSDASAAAAAATADPTVDKVIRILGLLPATKVYLKKEYPTQQQFEEFLQLSSEEVRATTMAEEGDKVDEEEDGEETDKKGKKGLRTRFNQADRAKLILLRRWTENNRAHGQKVKWEDFNRESFDIFVREEVPESILLEVLKELNLSKKAKVLKDNGVHTPASFVEKSKYWYEHEIELCSTDMDEIEKFKKWYKYQLDDYLPSDWIMAFRNDRKRTKVFEWRKVLKAIGLDDDMVQTLEINDICDFASLIYTSEKWRITKPTSKKNGGDVGNSDWNEWQCFGLKESDARNIINFCRWHKFYVAGEKDKNNWAIEFNTAHYERFVQRYVDPSKPDEFKTPGWWASKNDSLKLSQENHDYFDILHQAVEAGSVTEEQRYQLRQHYKGRREKMELIQEINEGAGDSSFQEERLGEIFEEEAANDHEKSALDLLFFQKYYQFFFSALIVYALLGFWCASTVFFMFKHSATCECKHFEGSETTEFIHNIVFGLVTAVVIQELGEDLKETSLYRRFLGTYRERWNRSKEHRFKNKLLVRSKERNVLHRVLSRLRGACEDVFTSLILNSTRIYILTWILLGIVSVVFGAIKGLETSNPLYTTGQTWLGIAVSVGYSFFGLSNGNKKASKDENDKMKNDVVHSATDGGEDDANYTNGGEETEITKERDKMLPTAAEELESQLAEAVEKMRAAADRLDFVSAEKFRKDTVKLKQELNEEDHVADGGDASLALL